MEEIALHIMDIVENSISGGASCIEVGQCEHEGRLIFTIRDNGRGMSLGEAARASDPFYTTKEEKSYGLGIALFKQAAEETGGSLSFQTAPGGGTTITASFVPGHADMKPIGDIEETMRLMQAYHPEIEFVLSYKRGGVE